MRRPRLHLVLVTTLAAVSLIALAVARPEIGAESWNRGTDITLIAAWIVAVVASAWLLFATALCTLALAVDRPAVARRIAPTLPRSVRKLVEIAIAGACIAFPALPALPAYAAGPPPDAAAVVADQPVVRAPEEPLPAAEPLPPVETPAETNDTVVVRTGDNLWVIARASLTRASGTRPTEHDVARYWLTVIEANRSTLRSGDPSLIFPGEIVTLPPPLPVS